jgi:hypothetical protein
VTPSAKGVAPSAKPSIWRRIGAWCGPARGRPWAAHYSVGDGPLQLDPELRAAPRLLRPSACGELQTTVEPSRHRGQQAARERGGEKVSNVTLRRKGPCQKS